MFLQTSGHLLPVVTRHTVPSHPSFAQVAHAVISKLNAKELGCAGALLTAPPRRARGQARHQCWQREAGGMSSLGHMPCLCLPRAGKAATELSQHPSQHQKRIGLLQLFVLPSTLSKQDQGCFGKDRREHWELLLPFPTKAGWGFTMRSAEGSRMSLPLPCTLQHQHLSCPTLPLQG